MLMEWKPRRRGRPTNAERDLRRRLEKANRERLQRGLVTVLVWRGRLYCTSRCIIKEIGLFTTDGINNHKLMDDLEDRWGPSVEDIEAGRFGTPMNPVILLHAVRRHVDMGRWPFDRYEVRRHYATDVEHMRCRECGKRFRAAKPDTEWHRRIKRLQKKKWEQIRREGRRRYRIKQDQKRQEKQQLERAKWQEQVERQAAPPLSPPT
jgi:hypothetical protein